MLILLLLPLINCLKESTRLLVEYTYRKTNKSNETIFQHLERFELEHPNKTIIAYYQVHHLFYFKFQMISHLENEDYILVGFSDSANIQPIRNINFIVNEMKSLPTDVVYLPEIEELIDDKYLWHKDVEHNIFDNGTYKQWCAVFLLDWKHRIEKYEGNLYFQHSYKPKSYCEF